VAVIHTHENCFSFAFVDDSLPAWFVMWALALGIYLLCKLATWMRVERSTVSVRRSAAYFLAWPGMDAGEFLTGPTLPGAERPRLEEWLFAAAKMFFGIAILSIATHSILTGSEWLHAWLGMVGVVFVLHFGAFQLLSCFWRSFGIRAEAIMDWPFRATSVSEFWGKRWNRAFRDFTHQFVFRPLAAHVGATAALWGCFLASGLVHDLVISVPARGGFGKPTLFFLIQATAIGLERSKPGRRVGLGRGMTGFVFTAAALVLPLPLLFHAAFIQNVMIPFLQALGGIFG
jgi:hypothetical protein